jgi:unsaturated rhamnogalacturonyl hydrolase
MKKSNSSKKIILKTLVFLSFFSTHIYSQKKNENKEIENAMISAMEWQEQHPIYAKDPTDWTNGAYYIGVVKAHQATDNMIFLSALKMMGYRNQWKTWERFYHADDVAISYPYLYLNTLQKDLVNLKPTDAFIQDHLYKDHAWRKGIPDADQRNLWWWCDALFMAPPVLTLYAKHTKDNKYLDEMHQYYKQTYDLLYDKEEHLFARDVRFLWKGQPTDLKEKNGKKIFWARGNGWVLAGLALILTDMPSDYINRPFYENLFKEIASSVKGLQQSDGLWKTSLLSPESFNHGEASSSGFYTFALAWGINNKFLNIEEYKPSIQKAWKALMACQHKNGKVGWVQNIGASPEPATNESWQNFGTGAFLMAGSEIMKMK